MLRARFNLVTQMIEIFTVQDKAEGNLKAHDILKEIVNSQTLLALSGGTTPDYRTMIVDPGDITLGAICVVDERYGEEFHENSNEFLFKNATLFDYLNDRSKSLYKVLHGKDFGQTVHDYNGVIEQLFEKFPKKVGVMGVGTNMHTAGIFPNSEAAHSPNFAVGETVDDKFPQRITMTLKALGEFTSFIVLVFGEEKKEVVKKMLDENQNDMQKYPAIFYRKSPAKSYLITDQVL